jgi:hypothetical protein
VSLHNFFIPMGTYIAYSDESRYNLGRFRGIGMISLPSEHLAVITEQLKVALEESNVKEFKWSKLRTAKYRFAAQKIIEICLNSALRGILRTDVLIWDIRDSRHDIIGRDDLANLQRMYYHLLKNVLKLRWPSGSSWFLFPDEQSAIKWGELGSHLSSSGFSVEAPNLFEPGELAFRLRTEFNIQVINPIQSALEPLCQATDLFVGLGTFSWEMYPKYQQWSACNPRQPALFESDLNEEFSRGEQERCFVLREFNSLCKNRRLSVSLRTHRGLCTKDPRKPINFWPYEPQHDSDIAPTRNSRYQT